MSSFSRRAAPSGEAGPDRYELSVVVALTAADADSLRECLAALHGSCEGISTEVLVPYDERLDEVAELRREFPDVLFVDSTRKIPVSTSRHSHLRVDILRAEGLSVARGNIVALTEDCAIVAEGWARAILAAHEAEIAAVGGPIENGLRTALSEAIYLCDFSAYLPPLNSGPARTLSDANVAYSRQALRETRELWAAGYDETQLHAELARRGERLVLAREALSRRKRRGLKLRGALGERYVWGRWYARKRLPALSGASRALLLAAAWLLPAVLTARVATRCLRRGRVSVRTPWILTLVFLLQASWALGEWTGYLWDR